MLIGRQLGERLGRSSLVIRRYRTECVHTEFGCLSLHAVLALQAHERAPVSIFHSQS